MPGENLTTTETAKLLRVSNSTVQKLAREGRLSAIRVGKLWRFPKQSPDILLYKQKQAAAKKARMKEEKNIPKRKTKSGWEELLKLATNIGIQKDVLK